jgi:hypothetical protein
LLRYFPAFGDNEHLVLELVGMVEYAVEYGYYAPERDLTWSRKIDPQALTWEQFLKRTNWQGEPLTFGATASDPIILRERSGNVIAFQTRTSSSKTAPQKTQLPRGVLPRAPPECRLPRILVLRRRIH